MTVTAAPDLTALLARRVGRLRSSAIRDLLHLTARDDVLSLAGGLPAEEAFPLHDLKAAVATIDAATLQYSTTEGSPALREWVAGRTAVARDRRVAPGQVLVTSGSQQALDLLARVLVEPGDVVAIDDPAYLGALQAFELFGPRFLSVPAGEHGMDVDALERALQRGERVKLVYTVTDFGNPSGGTLPLEARRALAALAERYGFLVVEDDPYGLLRFGGEPAPPPIGRFTDRCVSLGTFSKTVVPGTRVGWVVGPPDLVAVLTRAKQGCDLHTSTLSQHLVTAVVSRPGWLEEHAAGLSDLYARRSAALCEALDTELGGLAAYDRPAGGLFCWVRLADGVDTRRLLPTAIAHGMAFVPGSEFAPDPGHTRHRNALRLSFATLDGTGLTEAVRRLAGALRALA